ncbi:MAG: hypothetical protein C4536_01720 [Actinobacteria bacterium]|jgi:hypothetical protein|nr:MAG: hypothetical protein C4536_01720 [Actinomycetota bacterium]
MRREKKRAKQTDNSSQANFLSLALERMDPEFMAQTLERNPEFVLGMMQSLDSSAVVEVVDRSPEMFASLFTVMRSSVPREVLRRMFDDSREIICEIVLRLDTDLLMEMMGFEDE